MALLTLDSDIQNVSIEAALRHLTLAEKGSWCKPKDLDPKTRSVNNVGTGWFIWTLIYCFPFYSPHRSENMAIVWNQKASTSLVAAKLFVAMDGERTCFLD